MKRVGVIRGVAFAVSAFVIGGLAVRHSLALALAVQQPAQALQIDGRQPTALALTTYVTLSDNPGGTGLAAAERNAQLALALDPTEVLAVVDLALIRDFQRRPADGLMRYAGALSRRDLVSQLWWIEYWSARGNIAQTLRHYDIALRTSEAAPTVLFPVLIEAVSEPDVAAGLAPIMARRPLWSDQFVQQLAQSGRNTDAIVRVLTNLARLGSPVADRTLATAVDRVLADGKGGQAWGLYARYRPRSARDPIRNPTFTTLDQDASAFDWRVNQEGVSVSPENPGVRIEATSGGGGLGLQQTVRFAPGAHRIRFAYDAQNGVDGNASARPVLSLRCQAGGPPLAQTSDSVLDVVVPSACPIQVLDVTLQPGDAIGGASAIIREIRLIK